MLDTVKSNPSFKVDSSRNEIRSISREAQEKLINDADYKYDRTGPAAKSWWERLKEWFWRKVSELFDSKTGSISIQVIKYVIIIVAISLVVFILLKNNLRSLFYGKSAAIKIDFKEFEEDIHQLNFDELIGIAVSKKNFRKAIRLHFLKLLKELTDHNLIKWQIDKTNQDYVLELANSKYNKHFRELSLLYEYIWYGDFKLDESNFNSVLLKFKEFRVQAE